VITLISSEDISLKKEEETSQKDSFHKAATPVTQTGGYAIKTELFSAAD